MTGEAEELARLEDAARAVTTAAEALGAALDALARELDTMRQSTEGAARGAKAVETLLAWLAEGEP